MDKAKQVAAGSSSASSSSFAVELFGPKDSAKSSSSSSKGLFGTIFDPPPSAMAPRNDSIGYHDYTNPSHGIATDYNKRNQKEQNKYGNENGKVEPCYFNSSIYYGGQEVYSPSIHNNSPPRNLSSSMHLMKKEGAEVDPNDASSNCASRGNWWQGSLYY